MTIQDLINWHEREADKYRRMASFSLDEAKRCRRTPKSANKHMDAANIATASEILHREAVNLLKGIKP